ncbi:hypothetical protein [Sphingobium baderi]|uniref:Uncharacterized protein n=1 Tax=Sphingobium baderi LL03 TaxID=1114964 RepID=T0GGN5_9SPHN|nr:hypothetical protein [Sphingobium baderi]EQB02876.1 hypothetical protein L485_07245 [Sphingobium baderi LL03]KMS60594.1 hypothetical protein V475_18870 [Sphingobium baderi LL03]
MTRHFPPPSHDAIAVPAMLIAAARCWREARDNRQPVQPGLFSLLSREGHDMLAPVFDSFLRWPKRYPAGGSSSARARISPTTNIV